MNGKTILRPPGHVVAAAAYVIGVALLIVTAGIVVHPASSHERPFPYLQIAANTKILKMQEMHFWLYRANTNTLPNTYSKT